MVLYRLDVAVIILAAPIALLANTVEVEDEAFGHVEVGGRAARALTTEKGRQGLRLASPLSLADVLAGKQKSVPSVRITPTVF